jgi:hypothetical protein
VVLIDRRGFLCWPVAALAASTVSTAFPPGGAKGSRARFELAESEGHAGWLGKQWFSERFANSLSTAAEVARSVFTSGLALVTDLVELMLGGTRWPGTAGPDNPPPEGVRATELEALTQSFALAIEAARSWDD